MRAHLRRKIMKLKDAMKLHNEDEVTVKKTGTILRVIEKECFTKEESATGSGYVNLYLTDGQWYTHKEVS